MDESPNSIITWLVPLTTSSNPLSNLLAVNAGLVERGLRCSSRSYQEIPRGLRALCQEPGGRPSIYFLLNHTVTPRKLLIRIF